MVLEQNEQDARLLESGEHISGPAADEYRHRVRTRARFAGRVVTAGRSVDRLLEQTDPNIHHGEAMTCVWRRETAACRKVAERSRTITEAHQARLIRTTSPRSSLSTGTSQGRTRGRLGRRPAADTALTRGPGRVATVVVGGPHRISLVTKVGEEPPGGFGDWDESANARLQARRDRYLGDHERAEVSRQRRRALRQCGLPAAVLRG
jgi:hypothetical protein